MFSTLEIGRELVICWNLTTETAVLEGRRTELSLQSAHYDDANGNRERSRAAVEGHAVVWRGDGVSMDVAAYCRSR